MTLTETISWLGSKSIQEKIVFFELLLHNLTLMNRGIWDDPETSDQMKLECLKWSNELAHSVLNKHSSLKRGEDNNSEMILTNIVNYRNQCNEVGGRFASTINSTLDRFKYLKNNQ